MNVLFNRNMTDYTVDESQFCDGTAHLALLKIDNDRRIGRAFRSPCDGSCAQERRAVDLRQCVEGLRATEPMDYSLMSWGEYCYLRPVRVSDKIERLLVDTQGPVIATRFRYVYVKREFLRVWTCLGGRLHAEIRINMNSQSEGPHTLRSTPCDGSCRTILPLRFTRPWRYHRSVAAP